MTEPADGANSKSVSPWSVIGAAILGFLSVLSLLSTGCFGSFAIFALASTGVGMFGMLLAFGLVMGLCTFGLFKATRYVWRNRHRP